jgi:hypothetical protein
MLFPGKPKPHQEAIDMIPVKLLLVLLGIIFMWPLTLFASPITEMVAMGQTIRVIDDPERGRSVLAIGFSEITGNRNQDVEIARNVAFEELAGFVSGRTITSDSRVFFELRDGVGREEFMSSIQTNVDATLRAVETERVGDHHSRVFVVLRVSPSVIGFSSEIRNAIASNEIIASGVASLDAGLDRARRLALEDALRSAVSQFGGVATAARSSVSDHTQLRSQISSRSRGSVSSYRVLEEKSEGGYFQIRIAAIIAEEDDRSADIVSAIQDNLGRPGYFVRTTNPLLRAELEKLIRDGGFHLVTDQSAARFVINATSQIAEFPSVGGITGRTTALTIRVQDMFSAEQLHVFENDPSQTLQVSTNEDLRERRSLNFAIQEISDDFKTSLAAGLRDQFQHGARVTVVLSGFDRIRMVDMFQNLLEEMPDVRSVATRPIQDQSVTFDVFYHGNPTELQTNVLKNAQRHRLFGLRLRGDSPDAIAFTF